MRLPNSAISCGLGATTALLIGMFTYGLGIESTPQTAPLREDRVELCDFGVTQSLAIANANLRFVFALDIGEGGAPHSIEVLKRAFLGVEPFRACFMRWRLPVANERVTVLMEWEHGKGWTSVRISGPSINRVIRVDPRFMLTSDSGECFPP